MKKRPKLQRVPNTNTSHEQNTEQNVILKKPNFRINIHDWTKLKILCLERQMTLENLLLEAVHDLFKKYKKDEHGG